MTAPTFLALLSVPWLLGVAMLLEEPLRGLVLGLNATSLVVFVLDKLQARSAGVRIPERVLHGLALLAPAGASLGRRLASHKTRHASFDASAALGLVCGAAALAAL